jgi:hypothetical protein
MPSSELNPTFVPKYTGNSEFARADELVISRPTREGHFMAPESLVLEDVEDGEAAHVGDFGGRRDDLPIESGRASRGV